MNGQQLAWIDELERDTAQLLDKLEHVDYEEFVHYVDRRDRIIEVLKLTGRFEVEVRKHEKRLRAVLAHDIRIEGRMRVLHSEARDGLQRMQIANRQREAYDMDYGPDGIFFDKRK